VYTASKLTAIIGQYRQIFAKDGICSLEETVKMLEVDSDFAGLESSQIKQIADKILNTYAIVDSSKRDFKEVNSERMELYTKGLADCDIAEAQGVTTSTVHSWRKKRGLKANFVRGITQEEENR